MQRDGTGQEAQASEGHAPWPVNGRQTVCQQQTCHPWTNDKEYKEFDDKAGLREVVNACIGCVTADLLALVRRAATSGSRRL
jgi:hypothetical protein